MMPTDHTARNGSTLHAAEPGALPIGLPNEMPVCLLWQSEGTCDNHDGSGTPRSPSKAAAWSTQSREATLRFALFGPSQTLASSLARAKADRPGAAHPAVIARRGERL